METSNKIGLVLSGGGYRGVAHIGVLKAMEELGITPDYISGTSAGAVVGSLYAAGHNWQKILELFTEIELFSINNYTLFKPGLLDGKKLGRQLEAYFKEDSFESLKIPMFIATTDLVEGKTRFFYEGKITTPIIASAAVPGVFSPIEFNDCLLCDGGVTNNFPIEPLKVYCDKIIGVYVNPLPKIKKKDLKSTKTIVNRAYTISRFKVIETKFHDCDVLISPIEVGEYDVFSKVHVDRIFQLGYTEAKIKLKEMML
ncbi:patatin-like phospholipase family protein [Formosa sp. PL04]|uniref:patatin-like phospholipase family protein n=1 Tax=Formosa sp. PL04 TaxID=3081755 RepID=UPI00298293C0|nr:patatin-like phospholipase family protein [Formosa sp. PL04]MDW5288944.1 patatin-like phospholipase family protein [Formosa sp. PL04]